MALHEHRDPKTGRKVYLTDREHWERTHPEQSDGAGANWGFVLSALTCYLLYHFGLTNPVWFIFLFAPLVFVYYFVVRAIIRPAERTEILGSMFVIILVIALIVFGCRTVLILSG